MHLCATKWYGHTYLHPRIGIQLFWEKCLNIDAYYKWRKNRKGWIIFSISEVHKLRLIGCCKLKTGSPRIFSKLEIFSHNGKTNETWNWNKKALTHRFLYQRMKWKKYVVLYTSFSIQGFTGVRYNRGLLRRASNWPTFPKKPIINSQKKKLGSRYKVVSTICKKKAIILFLHIDYGFLWETSVSWVEAPVHRSALL